MVYVKNIESWQEQMHCGVCDTKKIQRGHRLSDSRLCEVGGKAWQKRQGCSSEKVLCFVYCEVLGLYLIERVVVVVTVIPPPVVRDTKTLLSDHTALFKH